jgi:hypothetical protein
MTSSAKGTTTKIREIDALPVVPAWLSPAFAFACRRRGSALRAALRRRKTPTRESERACSRLRGAAAPNTRMLFVYAALLLAVAAYAQWALPQFTRSNANAWATRLLLVFLGIGVGYWFVRMNPGLDAAAVFLMGFALVHVPAALVLLLKSWRHEGRS